MPTEQLTRGLSELLTAKGLQFTQSIFGSRKQPISVEIVADDDQTLLAHLQGAGWKKAAEPDLHTLFQQLTQKSNKTRIPVAPAFWNGKINNWSLTLPNAIGSEWTILYLWSTLYRIGNAHVYVGITRSYASRENLLHSLQQMNMIQQHCKEKFVSGMTGEYLLNDHFLPVEGFLR